MRSSRERRHQNGLKKRGSKKPRLKRGSKRGSKKLPLKRGSKKPRLKRGSKRGSKKPRLKRESKRDSNRWLKRESNPPRKLSAWKPPPRGAPWPAPAARG